jgi:translocation and assembly module TamA
MRRDWPAPGLAGLCLTILISPVLPSHAAEVELEAPDEIVELVSPHLPEDVAAGRAGQVRLEGLIGGILATEGYFSPTFAFVEAGGRFEVSVEPGPRTTIAAVDVTVDGPIDGDLRQQLVAGWGLPVGRPFRQEDWSNAKQAVLARLLAENHAGARLVDSAADIDPATREARLQVSYDAGPRYRFGELQVSGLERYDLALVQRYNRTVEPGAPYREESLNALQAALQATPYFRSATVGVDRNAVPTADGEVTVPVTVRVVESPAHRVSFGAGYSSNTGARVEAAYQTPIFFGQPWEFSTGTRLEQKQQTVFADVMLPPGEQQWRNSIGVMAQANDIQGLRTERLAAGVVSSRIRDRLETRYSLTWQDEHLFPEGAADSKARALVPNAGWTWRQVDNLLDPRAGFVLQGQVGGGAKAVLSTQNFVRLLARGQYFVPLGRRDVLTLRGEAGYTLADSAQGVPQEYLFRTGGTGSVRGYAYKSLGVQDGAATVGGRYMATVSAEVTHWLNDDWGIAAFADAGNATDSLSGFTLAAGYGAGARWRSPAGPLAIDVAYGEQTGKVQLHISLAIAF